MSSPIWLVSFLFCWRFILLCRSFLVWYSPLHFFFAFTFLAFGVKFINSSPKPKSIGLVSMYVFFNVVYYFRSYIYTYIYICTYVWSEINHIYDIDIWSEISHLYDIIYEHLIPIRIMVTNKTIVGELLKEKEHSFTAGGNINRYSPYENQCKGFSKN